MIDTKAPATVIVKLVIVVDTNKYNNVKDTLQLCIFDRI
jgi:hypothetical protein